MHGSIQSFKIPPSNSRAFDPWLAEAGNLDRTSQVCPAEKTCFILKYRGLKVNSSPLRVNGSEKVYKVRVLKFGESVENNGRYFCLVEKKSTLKSDPWVGHLNTIVARRGGILNEPM